MIDSGVFHVFDDSDRARYVTSLASAINRGGVLDLLCFSEHTPGDDGPRRVTQAEIYASFEDGWDVEAIEPSRLEVRQDWAPDPANGWLARILHTG